MAMTRDQLRAARILLHLKQPELAAKAKMGVATLRRYEGGQDVGELYADSLQRVVEHMGIVFLEEPVNISDGSEKGAEGTAPLKIAPKLGVGVALRPQDELPRETVDRLLHAARKRSASQGRKKSSGDGTAEAANVQPRRRVGRPKTARAADERASQNAEQPDVATIGQKADKAVRRRGRPRKQDNATGDQG